MHYLVVISVCDGVGIYASFPHLKQDPHSHNRKTPNATELHHYSVTYLNPREIREYRYTTFHIYIDKRHDSFNIYNAVTAPHPASPPPWSSSSEGCCKPAAWRGSLTWPSTPRLAGR